MKMATWLEDVVQALKNLGGQAHRKQIFEEIKRIRNQPLPRRLEQTIQRVIQDHSSDSAGFRGTDLFRKMGNGVWALRKQALDDLLPVEPAKRISRSQAYLSIRGKENQMTTWLEDIVQALKNLGGQATLNQIYDEVKRIRTEPLPVNYQAIIRERIEAHSSDSAYFKGMDLFRKVAKGVWALRERVLNDSVQVGSVTEVGQSRASSWRGKDSEKTTWVESIVQALKNLGGKGSNAQICEEVRRIKKGPFPKSWARIVNHVMGEHSSDSILYRGGSDLFMKVGKGIWALRGFDAPATSAKEKSPLLRRQVSFQNYLLPDPLEEITNTLHTIKQYRDYQSPDSMAWKEYIKEFFQVLGFTTVEVNPRLYTLDVIGSNHTPEVVLVIVHPGENFAEAVPGLPWDSYCFLAAKYYQVKWGIITNGIQLKVLNYAEGEATEPLYWQDIDLVICNEQIDTFCSIYKVFSYIKEQKGKEEDVYPKGDGRNDKGLAERQILRLKFWEQLLEKARKKTNLHARVKPGQENSISAGAGKVGLGFNYVVRMKDAQVELYIDNGEAAWNKKVFRTFLEGKSEIEQIFGEALDWQLLPDKRASRIRYIIPDYGLRDEDQWEVLQEKMVDAMMRLEKAFRGYIHRI